MEIAVIGKEEFCLGFRLTGIKHVFETDEPQKAISEVAHEPSIGIAVLDENLLEKLDSHEQKALEDSLRPIYITLSTKASEDTLKKMIRKSIGVEL